MTAAAFPKVTAIILNTNRKADTLECLGSLAKSTYPNLAILVLDNASSDGSVEAIQAQYPGVEICRLAENKGYTGNNNVGIEKALADGAEWVFILNEDTTVSEGCIPALVQVGEAEQAVGITGPIVYHYDEPTIIQSAGVMMDRWWRSTHTGSNEVDRGQHNAVQAVDWLTGCSILVRRAVLEQIGGFDETYFYYNEETDLCYRARKAGWKVVYVPQGKVWHKGVQREYKPSPSVTYYAIRNHLLFLARHKAPAFVKAVNFMIIFRTLASWTLKPRWRHMREHRDAGLQALGDYFNKRWGKRKVAQSSKT